MTDTAFHKVPPQNIEAEESILSAILINNDTLIDILEILSAGDFYKTAHQKIFSAVIDLFNREQVLANLEPGETRQVGGRTVEIERWYDERSERVNKRIRLVGSGYPIRTFLESVRAYAADEVAEALASVGLSVIDRFGSFEGDAFDRESPRLIFVARKS